MSFDDQYAFRPSGSITAAIIALLHKITTMLLTNPYVVVIVLDYSKAFDTVRHYTLIEKFAKMELPDHVYNLLNDFCVSHEHCTVFNGVTSPFAGVNSSVNQGSGLGPSRYIVNASDLQPVTDGNELIKFADDFDLIIPARNIETVDSRITEMNNIDDWSERNNLKLNRNKSQEIIFYRPYSRVKLQVSELPGVPRVNSIKSLGVVLANNFSMEEHVSLVVANCASALYALRLLRSHGMRNEDLQTVFQATVVSRLQYASPAWWGFANAGQRERLEGFLRKSTKAGFYPISSPNFASICDAADDSLFRSVSSNRSHILYPLLPAKYEKQYNTRSQNQFRLPTEINDNFEKKIFIRIFYK